MYHMHRMQFQISPITLKHLMLVAYLPNRSLRSNDINYSHMQSADCGGIWYMDRTSTARR